MLVKWGKPVSGKLLFGMILVLIGFLYFLPPGRTIDSHLTMDHYRDRTAHLLLSDSLPHYRYQKMLDSLDSVEAVEDFFNRSIGTSLGLFDATVGKHKVGLGTPYFFHLSAYYVEDLISVSNSEPQSKLTYLVWDSVGEMQRSHMVTKPIAVKYQQDDKKWMGMVAIPIGNTLAVILQAISFLLLLLGGIAGFCCVTFIPLRFFYNLSKSKPFTEENIGGLYLSGWGILAIAIFGTLLKIIAHLFINQHLPPEIHFSYYAAIMQYWVGFVTGLSVLLLAKAFLQALTIKEEQDLTI